VRDARTLAAIVVAAAALRLGYVLFYPQSAMCEDCRMYDEVAQNVAAGHGFVGGFAAETYHRPVVHHPDRPEIGVGPIFPAFLATIYRAAGHRFAAVRAVQAVIGAAMLIPLFGTIRAILGSRAAAVATALAAVYPPLIVYTGFVLTETLSTALLVFAVWSTLDAWQRPTPYAWIRTGVAVGVAVLLREEFLAVFGVIGLLTLWRDASAKTAAGLATVAVAAALVMTPWIVRNYRTFGRFIPVSAHGADTLYLSVKGWTEWHFGDPELQRLSSTDDYLKQADALHDAAMDEIRRHPLEVARRRLAQYANFWLSSHTSNFVGVTDSFSAYRAARRHAPFFVKLGLLIVNSAVLALGLVGLLRAALAPALDRAGVFLLATPVVVLALVHLALFAAPRYQIPMVPFVLAGAGWQIASQRRSNA
jgi:4-amino-4-deoxy-L-arabinose transferase-like glycosyltransferase